MKTHECAGGHIYEFSSSELFPQVHPSLEATINSFGTSRMLPSTSKIPDVVVGVIAPATSAGSIFDVFEIYKDGEDASVRGWSIRGSLIVRGNLKLEIFAYKAGRKKIHRLYCPEGLVVGDFDPDLSLGAFEKFREILHDHRLQFSLQ